MVEQSREFENAGYFSRSFPPGLCTGALPIRGAEMRPRCRRLAGSQLRSAVLIATALGTRLALPASWVQVEAQWYHSVTPATRSRRSLPALKNGSFLGATPILSPVLGFLPV